MGNVSCGSRLSSDCTSSSADTTCETPVPIYPCGPDPLGSPCQENHNLEIRTNLYGAALATGTSFVTPACGQTAIVYIPGLTLAHVGSNLWSSIYGYYEIIAYNSTTQEVTLRNNCINGNSPGGVTVPDCSTFIVTPSPEALFGQDISYLAADFVIPAIGLCTTISVTTTEGLVSGYVVGIGDGQYTISAIIDSGSMTICNTGDGGTAGATVTALNGVGQFNYPIVVINNSSVLEDTNITTNTVFDSTHTPVSNSVTISYTNTSLDKSASLFYSAEAYITAVAADSDTDLVDFAATMYRSIDGGGPVIVNDQSTSMAALTAAATSLSKQITYSGVEVVPPGATRTITITGEYNWFGGAIATMFIYTMKSHIAAVVAF